MIENEIVIIEKHKQFKDIDTSGMDIGQILICQTVNALDPFHSWDYAVAVKQEDRRFSVTGMFKILYYAKIFAEELLCLDVQER